MNDYPKVEVTCLVVKDSHGTHVTQIRNNEEDVTVSYRVSNVTLPQLAMAARQLQSGSTYSVEKQIGRALLRRPRTLDERPGRGARSLPSAGQRRRAAQKSLDR